jgi:acetyl esterase/lipase
LPFLLKGLRINVQTLSFLRSILPGNIHSDKILLYKDTQIIPKERFDRARLSFTYIVAENLVLSDGLKARWNYNKEKLADFIIRTDQSRKAKPPDVYYKRFNIEDDFINGCHCYLLSPKGGCSTDKVIFYLYGGGLIYKMHAIHWEFVGNLVAETSLTVCIPMYPTFPKLEPESSVRFIIECYRKLIPRYKKIVTLSDSSGTNLNMSFVHYMLLNNYNLPLPECLILISPAMIAGNDESILAEMKKIEPYDVMLSVKMLRTLPSLFNLSEGELTWFTAPLCGDFSKFPPMYVFSGTFDIFYPQIAPFVERVRAQGKQIDFYIGYKMMHDWPIVPVAPECEAAFMEIVKIILAS